VTSRPLGIVHVASEMAPLAKVGGLADMVGALAKEQARRGHRVTVVLPRYASLEVPLGWGRRALPGAEVPWGTGKQPATFELIEPPMRTSSNGGAIAGDESNSGPRVLLVDHTGDRHFFSRTGIYDDPATNHGYPDNAERFLFFARAALLGVLRLDERVDVLHAHDHQAAWVPCFARTHEAANPKLQGVATVFTIHNLGYQGIHDSWVLGLAGFGGELFYPQSPFEFWGRVNNMKVGIAFADLISTVSPRYAQEITSNGEYGFGLEGVLTRRKADLRGILNGIDDCVWNPARDPEIAYPYDRATPAGKWKNRAALLAECGLPTAPDWPLIGMISRLVEAKGFDLIEQLEADLMRLEARFVVLGTGQARFQELFERLAREHPSRVHYHSGYDESFAHRIEAGCDLFLMPSRYEPCGLNQLYSLRYGTVPIVRATGGLLDTVEDFDPAARTGTGFVFQRYEPAELMVAIRRALSAYRQPHLWSQLRGNGMTRDFSWRVSADGYDRLYEEALARVAQGQVPTLDTVRASE
jgi:starch synthase